MNYGPPSPFCRVPRPGAPATFRWIAGLADWTAPDESADLKQVFRECGVDAFGLTTKKGKAGSAEFWRHERLPLHVSILQDEERQNALSLALQSAEDGLLGKDGLRRALRTTAEYALSPPPPGDDAYPKADPKGVSALAQSLAAEPRYWALLEPCFFVYLRALADAPDAGAQAEALAAWRLDVADAARRAFDAATVSFDSDARHLRAVAEGRARLSRASSVEATPPAAASAPASQLDIFS